MNGARAALGDQGSWTITSPLFGFVEDVSAGLVAVFCHRTHRISVFHTTWSKYGAGHWDVDDGNSNRERCYPDARPMPENVAHPRGWCPVWMQDVNAHNVGVGGGRG
jgi:hypothetical protein